MLTGTSLNGFGALGRGDQDFLEAHHCPDLPAPRRRRLCRGRLRGECRDQGARPRSSPTQAASPYNPLRCVLAASAPRLTRPAAILGYSAHGLSMRVDAKKHGWQTQVVASAAVFRQ